MDSNIQNIQQSMQTLSLNTEKHLNDPKTLTPHQAALLFLHIAIIQLAHQIMKSLQQHQHRLR